MVVIEANEVPLSIFRWYADRKPESTIATLLREHHSAESFVEESADRELYPSQTWATFATGVEFEKHGIYWYGDPKPAEFPLYWQIAAGQVTTGIAGTLHSSPLSQQGGQPGLRFALPDAFAADAETQPASLSGLQTFNLTMTRGNSRAVSSTRPMGTYVQGMAAAGRLVRPQTLARLGDLAVRVASGRVNRERLRTAQFLLLADVFRRLQRSHQPHLSVFFTNHVAANLHRYWPASFPDHWDVPPFDDAWVARYQGEIPAALDALDHFLGDQLRYCLATDRRLLVVTSMGQQGGLEVDPIDEQVLVVEDAFRFAAALGVEASFEMLNAMVPHLSMRFDSIEVAKREQHRLEAVTLDGSRLRVDRADATVTVTYHAPTVGSTIRVASSSDRVTEPVTPEALGFKRLEVNAVRAGRHMPNGTVLLANAPGAELGDRPIDLVELAPAILESIGVRPAAHHREPRISFG